MELNTYRPTNTTTAKQLQLVWLNLTTSSYATHSAKTSVRAKLTLPRPHQSVSHLIPYSSTTLLYIKTLHSLGTLASISIAKIKKQFNPTTDFEAFSPTDRWFTAATHVNCSTTCRLKHNTTDVLLAQVQPKALQHDCLTATGAYPLSSTMPWLLAASHASWQVMILLMILAGLASLEHSRSYTRTGRDTRVMSKYVATLPTTNHTCATWHSVSLGMIFCGQRVKYYYCIYKQKNTGHLGW